VIALDTNVVVRLLADDDKAQATRAEAIVRAGAVLVPKTVLLESECVLRGAYGVAGADIAAAFRRLLGLAGVAAEDAPAVAQALDWYEGGLDFADALHLASSNRAGRFATFDRALIRRLRRLGGAPTAFEP
jgi:predicted nucleic-acid-binding protein